MIKCALLVTLSQYLMRWGQTVCKAADFMWTHWPYACFCSMWYPFTFLPSLSLSLSVSTVKPGSHPIVRSSPNRISGGRLLSPKPTLFSFPFLSFLLPFWHMLGEVPEKSHTFQFSCSQNRITAGGTTEIHWVMWHVTLTHCTTTQGTQGS